MCSGPLANHSCVVCDCEVPLQAAAPRALATWVVYKVCLFVVVVVCLFFEEKKEIYSLPPSCMSKSMPHAALVLLLIFSFLLLLDSCSADVDSFTFDNFAPSSVQLVQNADLINSQLVLSSEGVACYPSAVDLPVQWITSFSFSLDFDTSAGFAFAVCSFLLFHPHSNKPHFFFSS